MTRMTPSSFPARPVRIIAAAKLAQASFLGTALDAMKMAVTTFIIPFAFVFHPELMSFPNLTWAVVPPLALTLVLQWTVSVAAYGYFRRDLTAIERGAFGAISVLGFAAMVSDGHAITAVFVAMLAVAMAWIRFVPAGRPTAPQTNRVD